MEQIKQINLNYISLWIIIGLVLSILYTILNLPFSLYTFFCIVFAAVIFRQEQKIRKITKSGGRECNELMEFLAELRHWYYVYSDVEEAVQTAIDTLEETSITAKLKELFQALIQKEDKPFLTQNRILYLIYINCKITMEYGDCLEQGKSVFVKNLGALQEELQVQKKHFMLRRHAYLGIIPVAVIPIYTLPLIRKWCCENLPELEQLYDGRYGILAVFGLGFLSCFIYIILCFFRYPEGLSVMRHPTAERLIQSERWEKWLDIYKERHKEEMKLLKKKLTSAGDLFELNIYLTLQVIYAIFGSSMIIMIWILAGGFLGIWLTAALLAATIGIRIPRLMLKIQEFLYKKNREQEAAQFQGIAGMMMGMSRVSVYELLEAMEETAICYKSLLRRCLLALPYDEIEALRQAAKEAEECKCMKRLLENLMMCDKLGPILALEEASKERKFYIELFIEEEKQKLEDQAAIAGLIAFIPFSAVVIFYLIVPFVYESLKELGQISSEFYT